MYCQIKSKLSLKLHILSTFESFSESFKCLFTFLSDSLIDDRFTTIAKYEFGSLFTSTKQSAREISHRTDVKRPYKELIKTIMCTKN
jgi:hypothetical protein